MESNANGAIGGACKCEATVELDFLREETQLKDEEIALL